PARPYSPQDRRAPRRWLCQVRHHALSLGWRRGRTFPTPSSARRILRQALQWRRAQRHYRARPRGGDRVAYPTHIAATLSGASLRQLAYWRRPHGDGPLLAPELGTDGGRLLYSFRDVVALRTFVYLRESLPLQRIRKAV